jgi:hypothetical protein
MSRRGRGNERVRVRPPFIGAERGPKGEVAPPVAVSRALRAMLNDRVPFGVADLERLSRDS